MGISSFLFEYPIWKIHVDGALDTIVVETREVIQRKIQLHQLDISTGGATLLPAYDVLQNWWCAMEVLCGDFLLFSENEDPNLPKPTLLKGYRKQEANCSWELRDWILQKVFQEGFVAVGKDGKQGGFGYGGKPKDVQYFTGFKTSVHNGAICTKENGIFKDFIQFLSQKGQPIPHQVIEYYETPHFLIMAYGYLQGQKLMYKLLIFNDAEEKVLDEQVFKNNRGLIESCFFIFGKSVLFLDNDYCLKGYEIA